MVIWVPAMGVLKLEDTVIVTYGIALKAGQTVSVLPCSPTFRRKWERLCAVVMPSLKDCVRNFVAQSDKPSATTVRCWQHVTTDNKLL